MRSKIIFTLALSGLGSDSIVANSVNNPEVLVSQLDLGDGEQRQRARWGSECKIINHIKLNIILRPSLLPLISILIDEIYFYHPFADKWSCYDTLEIKGLETKTFCGTTLPAPYTTKSNVVKLVMTSDRTDQGSGFDLTFTTETSMLQPSFYKIEINPDILMYLSKQSC